MSNISDRETLFADVSLARLVLEEPHIFGVVASASNVERETRLTQIAKSSSLSTRSRLQACRFLREDGTKINFFRPEEEPIGVVVEAGVGSGIDVLAAYADNTASYYNFASGGVVWRRPNPLLDDSIQQTVRAARAALTHIGLWEGPRRTELSSGKVRLNILSPRGLSFGEGVFEALAKSPIGGPILAAGTTLMRTLTSLHGGGRGAEGR
jgi:hypothetical protein